MFMQAIRKNLKQKGAAIVEYAILLAFVAIIGAALLGPTSIPDSIDKVVTNIVELLGGKTPDTGGEEKPPTEQEKPTPEVPEILKPVDGEDKDIADMTSDEMYDTMYALHNRYQELQKPEYSDLQGKDERINQMTKKYEDLYTEYKKAHKTNGIPGSISGNGQWGKN